MDGQPRIPSLTLSLVPVVLMLVLMGAAIVLLEASPHITLVICSAVVVLLGLRLG